VKAVIEEVLPGTGVIRVPAEMGSEEGPRRGRKRGRHNFEPGYKDMLVKTWATFSERNHRCPKMEEIEAFSKECFETRRIELEEEDPEHPLLAILEAPLDATQVKNLVNNEKKKRHKAVTSSSSKPGMFPFAALQGMPLGDAAAMMQSWLQSAAAHQNGENASLGKLPETPKPKKLQNREASSQSSAPSSEPLLQCRREPQSPPSTGTLTPMSKGNEFTRSALARVLSNFNLEATSEDESETHPIPGDIKQSFSGTTSNATTVARFGSHVADSLDTSSKHQIRPKPLYDLSRVVQCTAAEALGMTLFRQNFAESQNSVAPVQLLPDSPSASLGGALPNVASSPLTQSIASAAAVACNQALSGLMGPTMPINLFQIQELVKSVVEEQMQKIAAQQQLQMCLQQQQHSDEAAAPPMSQFWQVMQLVQGLPGQ